MDIKNVNNIDKKTVSSFGNEWERFDQKGMSVEESKKLFDNYFSIFPWNNITSEAEGFDMGCGSGRWASFIAPKVEKLFCIDPSLEALKVAKENLSSLTNCEYVCCTAENFSLPDESMDFGYSLGVLHHVSHTEESLINCVKKLKKNAPFLLYLYYQLDDRSFIYKLIWKLSDIAPTILEFLEIPIPPEMTGNSLLIHAGK